jgi:adhesin transport system outer membrane protein
MLARLGAGPVINKARLIGVAIAVFAASSPVAADTLEKALAALAASHPKVAAAQQNLQAKHQDKVATFSAYYPQLAVSGDAGYEHTSSPSRRASGDGPLSSDRETGSVSLTQSIWDGSKREARVDAAGLEEDVADITVDTTLQDLLLEGIVAYHEVLRQGGLLEIAKSDEDNLRQQLELEDERVQRGSGITVDVLQAKSRLQISKERRVAFEGRLRQAEAAYQQVFGAAPDIAGFVQPIPPVALLPADEDSAVQTAMTENPALQVSAKGIEIAEQERLAARADFFPKVDFVARSSWENNVDGVEGLREDYSFLVRVTWEIFSGFETKARVASAAHTYQQRMSESYDAQRHVAEDVRRAWEDLETSRQRVELLQNAVTIAEEVYAARQKLRESGKESAINVLDALSELKTAQITFIDAGYDARIAVYRVLRAMGHLRPVDMGLALPPT